MVFSYARSQQKLKRLARDAKGQARPGTPCEVAQEADAVLLAVHWSRIDDVLNQTGDLSGKVIVTCSLPMNDDNTELVLAHTSSGAEELAKRIPKARVVAAFRHRTNAVAVFPVSLQESAIPAPAVRGATPGFPEVIRRARIEQAISGPGLHLVQ